MSEIRGASEEERRGEAARGRGEVGTSEPPRMERALERKVGAEREVGRWSVEEVVVGSAVARRRARLNLMVAVFVWGYFYAFTSALEWKMVMMSSRKSF